MIAQVVDLAENLTPIALVGAGGIGKTSIALTALHHHRIKQRFGANRRFIRCDQFPTSRTHFLSRLSEVIGAGVENPESLTPLRPFLSSKEMILILDNAESILDPQGTDAQEIYGVVVELSQVETLCLCITSRISTVPQHCKRPAIPTLSMESACDIFYGIYDNGGRSDIINNLLKRLDFHALSITLLATTASHNVWDHNRLAREWDARRVQVLRTDFNESLAATIELSLASPTFRKLGPDARDLLGVVAFFPQGIDENNLTWLFPTISDRTNIFDKFCTLSLTYRCGGFATMLAPLREYLRPEDPASSPFLRTTKVHYFARLSVDIYPGKPGFEESRWITLEDVNIEHLLNVFTTVDENSNDVWDACSHFMQHLFWHKTRLVLLGPKVEQLPDDRRSKPKCLFWLSRLYGFTGNNLESKRLLIHALGLWKEWGDASGVAWTLVYLSDTNRLLGLFQEGVLQAKEALEIYERLDDKFGKALSWHRLANLLLHQDKQLDAAEEAASRAINLLPHEAGQFLVCQCHRIVGIIYQIKGETEKAITRYETALRTASASNWQYEQFSNHFLLARLFLLENRFGDAHVQIEQAELHVADNTYQLSRVMEMRARVWHCERKFGEAKSEASRAADIYEKIGAARELDHCRALLSDIEEWMKKTRESDSHGGCGLPVLPLTLANPPFSAQGTGRHLVGLSGHIPPQTASSTSGQTPSS